jgi:hypothetical protein
MKKLLNYIKAFILFFIPKKNKNILSKFIPREKVKPVGQPYIINITNNSDTTQEKVDILGSYEYLDNLGYDDNGDLIIDSITISSGIPGVKYKDILYDFMTKEHKIGIVYIQSSNANQILQPYAVNTKNINGNVSQKQIVPTIDPYQYQIHILSIKEPHVIDGFTKIIIERILPKTKVCFHLFPFIQEPKLSRFEKFVNWLQKR